MWGSVFLETFLSTTYNFGFPTSRNINILHLTQWQYWFWFFFSFLFCLYYIFFCNIVFKRTSLNSPKLNTSFRSHGKWGDLVVCFLPISWCFNILTNSNFLLRLVEWQSETNSYTLRIRGKQWYWVYYLSSNNSLMSYISLQQWGHLNWVPSYTSELSLYTQGLVKQSLIQDSFDYLEFSDFYSKKKNQNLFDINNIFNKFNKTNYTGRIHESFTWSCFFLQPHNYAPLFRLGVNTSCYYYDCLGLSSSVVKNFFSLSSNFIGFEDFEIKSRVYSITSDTAFTFDEFVSIENGIPKFKEFLDPNYVVIKQKRFSYKSCDEQLFSIINNLSSSNPEKVRNLFGNKFLDEYFTSKRLLRTFRLLTLPTNTNIGVITNSFDVIHSWFVPGLGLKLDCVPGRSTHHTLNIVNPGFYYGQCAEICGRYHHHMPIRLVALNSNHFLFWWTNKGINQLIFLRYSGKNNIN